MWIMHLPGCVQPCPKIWLRSRCCWRGFLRQHVLGRRTLGSKEAVGLPWGTDQESSCVCLAWLVANMPAHLKNNYIKHDAFKTSLLLLTEEVTNGYHGFDMLWSNRGRGRGSPNIYNKYTNYCRRKKVCACWSVESCLEICVGSMFHVHLAWQVWDSQFSPRLKFNKLRRYFRGEIWPGSCWQKDSRGKGLAVRRLNKHNFCPASVYQIKAIPRLKKTDPKNKSSQIDYQPPHGRRKTSPQNNYVLDRVTVQKGN